MTLEDLSNTTFLSILTEKFRQKKVIVFCGAGISYDSGVPLVNQIKLEVLRSLGIANDDINHIINTKIPFELFMQTLIEHSRSEVLFDLFNVGEPNANHHFLARLARQKLVNIIVTTNFDTLIESALEYNNVEYDVYYKGKDFAQINWESARLQLLKIHGSIHDIKNIAVTIKRVAEKRLYALRKLVLSKILNQSIRDSLFVMGYSCSDYFDVNPIIEECNNSGAIILFVNHTESDSNLSELPIAEVSGNNPFKKYKGIVVNAFTSFVTQSLQERLFNEHSVGACLSPVEWKKVVGEWINDARNINGNGIEEYLSGQVLNVCTKYGKAIDYFKASMNIAKEESNIELHINCLYSLGRLHRDTQRSAKALQQALRYLFNALKLAVSQNSIKKRMHCMLSLGVTLEDKKDHYKGIYYYEEALRFARKLKEKEIQSVCLGNIAIVFKNMSTEDKKNSKYLLRKSFEFQRRALDLSIDVGDKGSEGRTYGNMGIILSCLGQPEQAIIYYNKAYKIAVELDDVKHQGIWTYNKGYDLISSDKKKALNEIKAAKNIFSNIDPPLESYIAICEKDISQLERET